MAITRCPECGRGNVSDQAESCPVCGYNIKKHFDREKRKQTQIEERNQRELQKQKLLEKELNSIKMPEKPVFSKKLTIYLCIITSFLVILCLIIPMFSIFLEPKFKDFFLFVLGFDGIPLLAYLVGFLNELKEYKLACTDFKAYQNNIFKELQQSREKAINDYNKQLQNKCPHCSSIEVKRISTLNRTVSVATFGLASSKIGKQYECKKCHFKW